MSGDADNKSYLSGTITALNPWSSRSTTPRPDEDNNKVADRARGASSAVAAPAAAQRGGDHSTSHGYRLRIKSYPRDCPPLNVKWFHAVDSPLRKPNYGIEPSKDEKPLPAAKKWIAFSVNDSRSLEAAFHTLADKEEREEQGAHQSEDAAGDLSMAPESGMASAKPHHKGNRSITHLGSSKVSSPKVPVNEDYLFDVDIRQRELAPAYWLGPVYAVRRGTWFYVDGTNVKPCEENLAFQLEEGFIKTRPWINATVQRSVSQTRKTGATADDSSAEKKTTPPTDARIRAVSDADSSSQSAKEGDKIDPQAPATLPTHRLFGSHMNSVVAYQDEASAWLLSDDFMSRMSSSVYQRFAGGAHRSGTKVIRGFQDLSKRKAPKDDKRPTTPTNAKKHTTSGERAEVTAEESQVDQPAMDTEGKRTETPVNYLERQMSNLVSSAFQDDPKKQDEEARKREEQEIREDYREIEGDEQGREVDHLVLITHGIGQRLGARFETFNFIHDVNEFRKTLKAVYNDSEDLQALNKELDNLPNNCRIQVLPICWRHLLDFPRQSLKYNRQEHDLSDAGAEEDDQYPTLDSITLQGVPALRNIVADLALDVLLYQTPAYNVHISKIVAEECNRIFKLFKQRNPTFDGRISLIGHSLGSAVYFDLLADQVGDNAAFEKVPRQHTAQKLKDCRLDFDVDNLFCFGSPIGLFQMLNGKTLAGRQNAHRFTLDGSQDGIEDPAWESQYGSRMSKTDHLADPDVHGMETIASRPKCNQLYNIFHPTDPIAYRLEPLISSSMSSLAPQALPYTKKSFLGAPMGQGLTGIPARVGQTVSGFWSNFSSGLANNFINRSLGMSPEDAAKLGAPAPVPHHRSSAAASAVLSQQSVGAGTNITGGGVISPEQMQQQEFIPSSVGDDDRKRKLAQDTADAERDGTRPPTLIDSEIETLYSGFQKRQKRKSRSISADLGSGTGNAGETPTAASAAEARRLKREEAKVRVLNKNGRVDYSIQEGAFDISFLASIASHLAYWNDEDVSHFFISQLLSKQRAVRKVEL